MFRNIFKTIFILVFLVLGSVSGFVFAESSNLVFEHNLTTDHPWQVGAEYMADKIENQTEDYEVTIYPNGVLSNRDWAVMLEHTQKGVSVFMVEGIIPFSTLVPELAVFQLPFLFEDLNHYQNFVNQLPPVANNILNKLEGKGLKVLAIWPRPFRQLSNSKKPIRTPEDIQGMKYRVPSLDLMIDTFRAIGAQPVILSAGEMYTALQLGTVVGEDNGIVGVFDNKTYEVAEYQMIWNYMADGSLVVINKETWDNMPTDIQEIVRNAAIEAASKVITADQNKEEEAIKQMQSEGVTFVELTDDEKNVFKSMVGDVYDKYSKLLGQEEFEEFINAVNEAKE